MFEIMIGQICHKSLFKLEPCQVAMEKWNKYSLRRIGPGKLTFIPFVLKENGTLLWSLSE